MAKAVREVNFRKHSSGSYEGNSWYAAALRFRPERRVLIGSQRRGAQGTNTGPARIASELYLKAPAAQPSLNYDFDVSKIRGYSRSWHWRRLQVSP